MKLKRIDTKYSKIELIKTDTTLEHNRPETLNAALSVWQQSGVVVNSSDVS